MHKIYKLSLLLLIIISTPLFSAEKTAELQSIENLISFAKQNIELQEKIKIELIQYQKVNKAFIQNPKDNELLFETIKLANRLLNNIKEAHLTDNFSAEFIKELTLFSKLAKKQGIPKP